MPLYDYQCRECAKVTEVRHGFREAYEGFCPACGSANLARVFNPAGIVFKGSGFYITDSRKGSESKGSDSSGSGSTSSSSGSEAGGSAASAPAPKKNEASAA